MSKTRRGVSFQQQNHEQGTQCLIDRRINSSRS